MLKNLVNIGVEKYIYNVEDYISIANPRVLAEDLSYNGISKIITVSKDKVRQLHEAKQIVGGSLLSSHIAFSYIPQAINFCKRRTVRVGFKNYAGFSLATACNIYKYCPVCNAVYSIAFYEFLRKVEYLYDKIYLASITTDFRPFEYIPDHEFRWKDRIKPDHVIRALISKVNMRLTNHFLISVKPSLLSTYTKKMLLDFYIVLFDPKVENDVDMLLLLKDMLKFTGKDVGMSLYQVSTDFVQVFDLFSFLSYRVQPELLLNYGVKIHPLIFYAPGIYYRGLDLPMGRFLNKQRMLKFLDTYYRKKK